MTKSTSCRADGVAKVGAAIVIVMLEFAAVNRQTSALTLASCDFGR